MKTFITPLAKQNLFFRLRNALLLWVLLLSGLYSHAQLILHSPNTIGNYSDRAEIVLDSGFTSEPTGSQQFIAYMDNSIINPLAEKPSNSQNYVITYTPRVPGITRPGDTTLTNAQVMAGIQYTDGLGRPKQSIQIKGSPQGNDMIQPIVYDTTGRQTTQYLPYSLYSNNSGAFRNSGLTEQAAYYNPSSPGAPDIAATSYPMAPTRYEISALNRPLEQGAPGADWQLGQHTKGIVYTTNDTASVNSGGHWAKNYMVQSNGSLAVDTAFDAGQLTVTITHDENWTSGNGRLGTMETYTDKDSHTLLKRTFNYNVATSGTEVLSTYYVYDDLGNLRYIIPPTADPDNPTTVPSAATLNAKCYQYVYDGQNHLTGKKIPGKGMGYILYNRLDRPVIAQDSVQRADTRWAALKYDKMGRVIMAGIWDAGSSPALSALQDSINKDAQYDVRDTANTTTGYAISSYPAVSHPLTINYYDNYNIPNLPAAYDMHTDTAYSSYTRGLLTATKTAILKADGTVSSDMLWTVYYYDKKGRPVKTFKQHYLGGVQSVYNYDEVNISYDFTGNPTRAIRNHYAKNSGNTAAVLGVAVKDSLVYDHLNRPIQVWNQINNGTKVLVTQTDYNELGQAISQHLHSTDEGDTFLQDISYAYNERGMMTKNSAPLFAEQLKYNDGTTPQYNGNIANQLWGTPGSLSNTYTYSYDKVNRLTSGSSAGMSETGIQYDLAGNIQSLTRDSHTISYSYNNNQLSSVSGTGVSSGTYTYDGNGNVVNDGSNGYTFTNNMLNLPRLIKSGTDSISYAYDATGDKLSKSSTATGLTEYVNGIQYGSNTGSYGIDFVTIPGGRAERKSDGTYRYEYDLTDHLGNARVTIEQNPTTLAAEAIQQDDYYPFGLRHSLTAGDNQYLYNGKEVQPELNQYDYGARFYNPAIGRWNGVDQLAEMGPDGSPYNYVTNNPIAYIDPDGRWHFDAEGNIWPSNSADDLKTLLTFLDENWLSDENAGSYSTPDIWAGNVDNWDAKTSPFDQHVYIPAGTFKHKENDAPLILPSVPIGGYTEIPYIGNGSSNYTPGSSDGGGSTGGGAGGGSVKQGGGTLFGTTLTTEGSLSTGNSASFVGKNLLELKYTQYSGITNDELKGTFNFNTTIRNRDVDHDVSVDIGKFSYSMGLNSRSIGYNGYSLNFSSSITDGFTFGMSHSVGTNITGAEYNINPFKIIPAAAAAVYYAAPYVAPFFAF